MNALLWVTFFGTYPCSGCEPSRWSTPYCWNRGLLQTLWAIAPWIPAVSHWTGTSMLSVAQATHVRASLCTPLQMLLRVACFNAAQGLAATEVFVCDAWLMLHWLYAGLYDGLQKFFCVFFSNYISWAASLLHLEPSGPKSRDDPPTRSSSFRHRSTTLAWFRVLLVYMLVTGVVGARVASDATGSLTLETTGGSHTSRLGKRAFHRAQQRAQVAGGAFYKGKWCTAQSLHVTNSFTTTSRAPLRPGAFRGWKPRQDAMPLNIITWNSSGLSEAVLPEFLLWVDTLPADSRPNFYSYRSHTGGLLRRYKHGDWLPFHSGISEGSTDRYAGLLTLVRIPGISIQNMCECTMYFRDASGTFVLILTYRNVDVVHVYQHAASSDPAKTLQEKRLFNRLDAVIQSMPECNFLVVGGDFNLPCTGNSLTVFLPRTI